MSLKSFVLVLVAVTGVHGQAADNDPCAGATMKIEENCKANDECEYIPGTVIGSCRKKVSGKCTGNTGGTGDVDCSGQDVNRKNRGSTVDGSTFADCCEPPADCAERNATETNDNVCLCGKDTVCEKNQLCAVDSGTVAVAGVCSWPDNCGDVVMKQESNCKANPTCQFKEATLGIGTCSKKSTPSTGDDDGTFKLCGRDSVKGKTNCGCEENYQPRVSDDSKYYCIECPMGGTRAADTSAVTEPAECKIPSRAVTCRKSLNRPLLDKVAIFSFDEGSGKVARVDGDSSLMQDAELRNFKFLRSDRGNPDPSNGVSLDEGETLDFGTFTAPNGFIVEVWLNEEKKYDYSKSRESNFQLPLLSIKSAEAQACKNERGGENKCVVDGIETCHPGFADVTYEFDRFSNQGRAMIVETGFPNTDNIIALKKALERTDTVLGKRQYLFQYDPVEPPQPDLTDTDKSACFDEWNLVSVCRNPDIDKEENTQLRIYFRDDDKYFAGNSYKDCKPEKWKVELNWGVRQGESVYHNKAYFIAVYALKEGDSNTTQRMKDFSKLRDDIKSCDTPYSPPIAYKFKRSIQENGNGNITLCANHAGGIYMDNACEGSDPEPPYDLTRKNLNLHVTDITFSGTTDHHASGVLTFPDGTEWTKTTTNKAVKVDLGSTLNFEPKKDQNSWRVRKSKQNTYLRQRDTADGEPAFTKPFATIKYKLTDTNTSLETTSSVDIFVYPRHDKAIIADINTDVDENRLYMNSETKITLIKDLQNGTDQLWTQSPDVGKELLFPPKCCRQQYLSKDEQCANYKKDLYCQDSYGPAWAKVVFGTVKELPEFGEVYIKNTTTGAPVNQVLKVGDKFPIDDAEESLYLYFHPRDYTPKDPTAIPLADTTFKFSVTTEHQELPVSRDANGKEFRGSDAPQEPVSLTLGEANKADLPKNVTQLKWDLSIESDPINVKMILNNDVAATPKQELFPQIFDNNNNARIDEFIFELLAEDKSDQNRDLNIILTKLPDKGKLYKKEGAGAWDDLDWKEVKETGLLGKNEYGKKLMYNPMSGYQYSHEVLDTSLNKDPSKRDRQDYQAVKPGEFWSSFTFEVEAISDDGKTTTKSSEAVVSIGVYDTNDQVKFFPVDSDKHVLNNEKDPYPCHEIVPLKQTYEEQKCEVGVSMVDPLTPKTSGQYPVTDSFAIEEGVNKDRHYVLTIKAHNKASAIRDAAFLLFLDGEALNKTYSNEFETVLEGGYGNYQRNSKYEFKCSLKGCNALMKNVRFRAEAGFPPEFDYKIEFIIDDKTDPKEQKVSRTFVHVGIFGKKKEPYELQYEWISYVIIGVSGVAGLAILVCMVCVCKRMKGKGGNNKKAKKDIYLNAL